MPQSSAAGGGTSFRRKEMHFPKSTISFQHTLRNDKIKEKTVNFAIRQEGDHHD